MNQNNNINDTIAITEQAAKQRVYDEKLGNISKLKREELSSKIEMIRKFIATAPQDENTSALLSYVGELEKEIKSKKYGLVFEEHRETIDEILENNTAVLTEQTNLFIDNGGELNFLIEGDNLASLNLLLKTHRNKIDLIYIDPPYNRGKKDFIYNDKYIGTEDAFKHSKWSSFMKKRLKLSRQLLSSEGVIFIHIDDNEQHVLRMLCDEVFSISNFIGIIIQNKLNSKNDSADIQKNHEYILVYRKVINLDNEGKPTRLLGRSEVKEREVFEYNGNFYYLNDFITTRGEGGVLVNRSNLGHTVYYNPVTCDFFPEHDYDFEKALISDDEKYVYQTNQLHINNGYLPIRAPKVRGKLGVWTWSADKMKKDREYLEIVKVKGRGYSIKSRTFVPSENVRSENGKYYFSGVFESNVKSIIEFSTNDGSIALTSDMGEAGKFDNPKNIDMMIYLINLLKKNDPIVLDFFAGSGTTGRAVLSANKLYGGNRKFILCTNNENNICRDITYERCKRSIEKENYKTSLKYYKVGYVPVNEKMYYEYADELLLHIRELVELENGIDFNKNMELTIILSDDEADDFFTTAENLNCCKKMYLGHDVLLSGEQEQIIKNNGIELIIIPNYYYKELED